MLTEDEFSQMLDEDDRALLTELGETLRREPELELPVDFARQTARSVEQRFQTLSPMRRRLLSLESRLAATAFGARALPWSAALLAGLMAAGAWSLTALLVLGVVLAALSLGWKLARYGLPGPRGPSSVPILTQVLSFSYYLVPLWAAASTGIFCGGIVWMLGTCSLTFSRSSSNPLYLSWAAGLGVFLFLLSTLAPAWRALHRHSLGRPLWLLGTQLLYAAWLAVLLHALVLLSPESWTDLTVMEVALPPALLVSLALSFLAPREVPSGALGAALRKTGLSLLLGGLPILGLLAGFYQLNLTRKIERPGTLAEVKAQTRAWVEEQRAIPPHQNGWTEFKPYLLRSGKTSPVTQHLNAGSKIFDHLRGDAHFTEAQLQEARRDFLMELPRLESALAKPRFSSVSTQGLSFEARVPNFIACRAVSRGLAGLAEEALNAHQTADCLHYTLLNLRWSNSYRQGTLIYMMIGIAQLRIATDPIERWLLEGHPDLAQLQRLQQALRDLQLGPHDFERTMARETVCADEAFEKLLRGENLPFDPEQQQGLLLKITPRSYWESERKAYLNLQLAGLDDWRELGKPDDSDPIERLPFSYIAREFAPNTRRAQVQFMLMLSRLQALETMTALEIYRRRQGAYPDELRQLQLDPMPVDAMHPNLWDRKPTFTYRKTAQGYQLISESPLYPLINYKPRQVYGYDGKYELEAEKH